MFRPVIFLCLLATALIFSSCVMQGELRVRNHSTTDINVSFNLNEEILSPTQQVSKFYTQDTNVHVEYDGLYIFRGYSDRYIQIGDVDIMSITSDGGAIQIINNSPHTITNVYLALASSTTWGSDDLTGTIPPGGSTIWTTTPGVWDIRIVNNLSQEFYSYAHTVVMDQTNTLAFTEDKATTLSKKADLGIDSPTAIAEQKEQGLLK